MVVLQVRERCPVLDEILVDLVMEALEKCELEISLEKVRVQWQRLCGLAISYAIFSLLNFAAIISTLSEKVWIRTVFGNLKQYAGCLK